LWSCSGVAQPEPSGCCILGLLLSGGLGLLMRQQVGVDTAIFEVERDAERLTIAENGILVLLVLFLVLRLNAA
jgi:hypothetical protein